MSEYFRYPSIIKLNQYDNYLISININDPHTGNTILLNLKSNEFPYDVKKNDNVIISDSNVVHNFTIFKDITDTFYYGIGGLIRDQHPYNDFSNNSGLFLYKSFDTKNWEKIKDINPIISLNKHPKNPIISIERKCPEFDSNICCFYSRILKTYLLFGRANIARGSRSTQITTTNDFINFTDFKLFNIDTFTKNTCNNYMFKCVEILEYNVFFALVPYTNRGTYPSKFYIKKLISYDAINWIDCGKLCNSTLYKDRIHINTHVAEILYSNNMLEIILFENVNIENCFLRKKTFKINENPSEKIDFKEFICQLIF